MHVLLIRHGRHGIPAVPSSGNLTLEGLEQARITGLKLASQNLERLLASPYPRAMQTAQIISRIIEVDVEIFRDLHNKTRSREQVLKRSEISERHPEFIIPEDLPENWLPHEEKWEDLYRRAARVAKYLVSLETSHERIAIVSHAVTLDALTSILLGLEPLDRMRFWYDNCSLTLLSVKGETGRLKYLNEVSHLMKREIFF
jgi:probable phosphoglycerate mutase